VEITTLPKPGLTPVNKIGGPDPGQINMYKVKNGGTRNLFTGALARTSAGYVKDVTLNTQTPLGVFNGFMFSSPITGQPTWSEYVPSGTSSNGVPLDGGQSGSFGIIAYVLDDPNQEYIIQANASIPASAQGAFAQVSVTGGSSFSGRSNARLDYSAAGTSAPNAMFKITGCPVFPYNVGFGVSAGDTSDGPPQNPHRRFLRCLRYLQNRRPRHHLRDRHQRTNRIGMTRLHR